MSGTLNKVIIIGRLGADPESVTLPSGTPTCRIRLATDHSYKNDKGEKVERTEWHRITSFGKVAEVMGEHLKKGRLVLVEGENRTRKWTDQNGVDRWTTEVVANNMRFLDSAPKPATAEAAAPAEAEAPEVPF